MNGIGADGRAAMLNHLDSLLDDSNANDLEEVRLGQVISNLHGSNVWCCG